jgi:hypothetical protein
LDTTHAFDNITVVTFSVTGLFRSVACTELESNSELSVSCALFSANKFAGPVTTELANVMTSFSEDFSIEEIEAVTSFRLEFDEIDFFVATEEDFE